MTTSIVLDFDSMPDEQAERLCNYIEGFVAGRFPYAAKKFHGGRVEQERPKPPDFSQGLKAVKTKEETDES